MRSGQRVNNKSPSQMIWFLAATTLLLFLGILARDRRTAECTALAVLLLTPGRWLLEKLDVPTPALVSGLPEANLAATGVGHAISWVWLGVVTILFVRMMWHWRLVRKWSERSRALSPARCAEAAAVLGVTRGDIRRHFRISADVVTPVALPIFPSTVLLPAEWSNWPARLRASALRHEWHHVRYADAWWHALLRCICCVFWFHPLVWILTRIWSDACERAADHAAVQGTDPVDYADDLLALINRLGPGNQMVLGMLQTGRNRFGPRIESILRPLVMKPVQSSIALLLVIALGVACTWLGVRHAGQMELRREATLRLQADAFPAE
jgi:beta-lactamase regulating signal transducer with metallopeptidase domain